MTVEYRILRCGCAPSCFVVLKARDDGMLEPVASFSSARGAADYVRSVRDRHAGQGRAIPKKRVRS